MDDPAGAGEGAGPPAWTARGNGAPVLPPRWGSTVALLAPLPAAGVGALAMRGAGLPAGTWALNVGAAGGGVVLALVASGWGAGENGGRVRREWLLGVGLALLALTLAAPGVQGVHRWLPVGPVRVHAAALLFPPMLVALAGCRWATSATVAITALVAAVLQPDAAQALSFAAGWVTLVVARRARGTAPMAAVALALGVAGLFRPDPLGPVAHVEGIVGMAMAQGMVLGVAAVVAASLPPICLALCLSRPAGAALAVYAAGTLVGAWLGDHPVPILGFGVAPILGYYGAVATDAGLGSRPPG